MAQFLTPKGRLVQGSAFVPGTTDYDGNKLIDEDGKPYVEYQITVAFPKGDPTSEAFINQLGRDCLTFWPTQFPNGLTGSPPTFGAKHPRFSSKVIDGDGVDGKGNSNAAKEGMAGHWCVVMKTRYAIKVFEAGKYDPMEDVALDPGKHSLLKRGYFIRVSGNTDTNASDQTPGIKVYPNMIEIVHAGPEISSGPDARAVFGGGSAPVPPSYAQPPAAPAPTPAAYTPPAPVGASATPSPSSPPPAPYSGYIPAAPPAPPAPPVPTGPVMLPAANGATYEQMIAAGWTDATLRQHGMMA